MKTAKLFNKGNYQAVLLPNEFRFSGDKVAIRCSGNTVILSSQNLTWDTLVESLDKFSSDFMDDRDQPQN